MRLTKPVLIIALLMVLLFSGCNTLRKQDSLADKQPSSKKENKSTLLEKLLSQQKDFRYLSAKLNIQTESLSLGGQIRILKGEKIWISLSKFGIEVARLLARPDSIFFINKFEESYYAGKYDQISAFSSVPISYDILEALLLGEDFSCYEKKNAILSQTASLITLSFKNRQRNPSCKTSSTQAFESVLQTMTFSSSPELLLSSNTLSLQEQNLSIHVDYLDYTTISADLAFPLLLKVSIKTPSPNHLNIQYQKPSLQKISNFPFSIPKRYSSIL